MVKIKDNTGLSEQLLRQIQQILSANDRITSAVLFGSRAKGNFREGSDIDIALKGDSLRLDDVLKLSQQFDELPTLKTIDIVLYHTINTPELRQHIERVGIELYNKDRE